LERKHIDLPGNLVNVEAMIDQIATGTAVCLSPHQIREDYFLVAEFGKGEEEIALTLPAGVIHDHDVASTQA
jgi:hypothetical protein